MKKLLFIAIIAVLGCTALQAKNRIRIKRESWEVKASTRVPISTPLNLYYCLLYTSPSPRDVEESRMPSSA